MEIALIIVGGLTIITFLSAGFDYLGKRAKRASSGELTKLDELERRLGALEVAAEEKDGRIASLERELSFVNRLIADTTASDRKAGGEG